MATTYSGGCLCGEIRYECDGEALRSFFCHCRDCKRANGSAFTAGFAVPKDSLRIEGTPKDYTNTGESGSQITRQFCANCGSALFTVLERNPTIAIIKAGSLDDPGVFKPMLHIWTQTEMSWEHMDDGLERFPKGAS